MHPPSSPTIRVPEGAWDCHVHVFGDLERYPPSRVRRYTPLPVGPDLLRGPLDSAGVRYAVLVQPSSYGEDNTYMLECLRECQDRFRAVAVIGEATGDGELTAMHELGVRGVRLNLAGSDALRPDHVAGVISSLSRRISKFGWHLQIFASIEVIARLEAILRECPIDLVFDHMGKPDAAKGTHQRGLDMIYDLMQAGRAWAKLSGPYRVSPDEFGNPDVTRLARALIAANPKRVVWGSDWPHIADHAGIDTAEPPMVGYRSIDYPRLISLLGEWTKDQAEIDSILVSNPAALYGLSTAS